MIGNLGVDLLIIPLSKLLGREASVKLIVLAASCGRRARCMAAPPTALFALPFIYGFPFLFGFANFTLSVALAFLGFALWLRLGRLGRTKLRGWLFAPLGLLVFFCYVLWLGAARADVRLGRGGAAARSRWSVGARRRCRCAPVAVALVSG